MRDVDAGERELMGETQALHSRITKLEQVSRDASDRKKAEEEIAKLAKLPSENPYPVLRIHKDGTVLYTNKASEGLLKARSSGIGQPAPAEWHRLAKEVLASGRVTREEAEHDGHVFAFRAVPITDSDYVNFYGTDITDQKRAQEALRESEDKFKTLAEEAFDAIVIHDGEKVIEVNKAFGKIWGWEPQQAIGTNTDEFVTKESMKIIRERIKCGYDRPYEVVGIRRDGTRFPLEITGKPITYKGKPARIVTARDISDRKLAEEALRESEERFRHLYEQAPLGYQSLDAKARFIDVNQAWLDLLGYSRDQVIGHWFGDFLAPQEVDAFKQRFSRFKAAGEVHVDLEMVQLAGSTIIVHIDGRIAHDEHGQFKQTHCILHDITAQKRAEDALRETTQTLEAVIQASPLPISAVDRERIVKTWNPAAERTFGWSAQEVIGRQFPAIPKEKMDEADALFSRAMESGLIEVETLRQRKDGSLIDVSISAAPLRDSRGNINGVMAVITDITERKQAEQKLLEDQAQLKSLASQLTLAEESERRRLATELHDRIGQSLVISKIKLDALRKSGRSRKLDKALEDICNSIDQTIQDTRTLTFDLGSPVLYELGFETAVSEWLTDRIQKKHGITVEFKDDGEPKPLDDDVRILLFRDVRELLTNVVKHAGAHKVKVSIKKLGDQICVMVEDDGVGFDPAEVISMAAKRGEFGLFSIRERLEGLGRPSSD